MRGWIGWIAVRSFRGVLRRRQLALVGLAACLLPWGGAAQAQARGPCGQEVRKLCPDLRPGTAEFRACFEEHKDELSPQCRERLSQGQERIDKMRAACASDIETHCGEIPEGGGNLLRCLNDHADELSDGCKQSIPRRAGMRRGPAKAPAKAPAQAEAPAPEAEAEPEP